MNLWMMIFLIVLVGVIGNVLSDRYKALGKQADKADPAREKALETERDQARGELEQLRDRVKVLERIATDPARRTAEEIEDLRDR